MQPLACNCVVHKQPFMQVQRYLMFDERTSEFSGASRLCDTEHVGRSTQDHFAMTAIKLSVQAGKRRGYLELEHCIIDGGVPFRRRKFPNDGFCGY